MNGPTHQLVAALAIAAGAVHHEDRSGQQPSPMPLAAGALGALFTGLPDILEPATSPDHRQVFHSIALAFVLGVALHKVFKWQPEDPVYRFWRKAGILGLSASLIHLGLDAMTAKSLPLIGKL